MKYGTCGTIGNLLENLLKNRELLTKQYMVTVDKITVYTLKSASPLINSFKPKNEVLSHKSIQADKEIQVKYTLIFTFCKEKIFRICLF